MKRKASYFFSTLIIFYAGFLTLGYMLQRTFILHPKKLAKTYVYNFDFSFEELEFPTTDGSFNAIHAYTDQTRKGVIVYFHGNADNLVRWGAYSSDFLQRGYDVVMMDYRGFGKSDGKATEENMYSDALQLYNYVSKQYNAEEIVLYGRSLGSGVASHLAKTNKAKQLILETPFYSIPDVVRQKFPFILQLFELNFDFPNHKNIDGLDIPVHIFHGTKDKVVPFKSAIKLEDYLQEDDSFLVIPGGGHKNLSTFPAYQQRLDKILL